VNNKREFIERINYSDSIKFSDFLSYKVRSCKSSSALINQNCFVFQQTRSEDREKNTKMPEVHIETEETDRIPSNDEKSQKIEELRKMIEGKFPFRL
jgi:hypothetical protein